MRTSPVVGVLFSGLVLLAVGNPFPLRAEGSTPIAAPQVADSTAQGDSARSDSTAQGADSAGASRDSLRVEQPQSEVATDTAPPSVPVSFRGEVLWNVRVPLGAFGPEARAVRSEAALDSLAEVGGDSLSIGTRVGPLGTDVLVGSTVIRIVTEADAAAASVSTAALVDEVTAALQGVSLTPQRQTLSDLARGGIYTALATALLFLALTAIGWLFPRLYQWVDHEHSHWIRGIKIQRLEVISAERITQGATVVLRALRVILVAGALYFFLPLVLSFFPPTAGIADQLVGWVVGPLSQAWSSVIRYLPNVFRIAVILVVMYYALQLVHLVFEGLRSGRIRMRGFYSDWALPTYQIVRFLLVVLTAIVVWPYLPMSDSPGFRGIAAFLGLLLTFGSASAIANMVGGIVLIYMRSFQIGDRVKISATVGDVIEKGLLVTRIRTSKNVNVTIPNSMVLGDHLINYSRAALREGVILHTGITLGYDVPWRKVHDVLKGAALGVEGVMDTPEPFVLQTALDDFYVAYELNVYTRTPSRMALIYSDLHARIQDACNEAGIEILSPHFRAERDGNPLQVPPEFAKA